MFRSKTLTGYLFCLLFLLFAAGAIYGQPSSERFYGKLTGLIADPKFPSQRVLSSENPMVKFSPAIENGADVYLGTLIDPRASSRLTVAIVEAKEKPPVLGIDQNTDGTIEASERHLRSSRLVSTRRT